MITTKETGTQYSELTQLILDFHDERGYTIAFLQRPVTKDSNGTYVDDITADEVSAGRDEVTIFKETRENVINLLQERGRFGGTVKEKNKKAAKWEQQKALKKIEEDDLRVAKGLVPFLSEKDKQQLIEYAKLLDDDVIAPSEDEAYNPPLPPGVGKIKYKTIKILVERVEGWQGNLGWRAVITSIDDSFSPTNLAMAWYNSPDCTDYVATTGAFQQDGEGAWYAVCPAGSEPGDVDIHFGLLLASAPLSCFTMPAGVMAKSVLAYEQ